MTPRCQEARRWFMAGQHGGAASEPEYAAHLESCADCRRVTAGLGAMLGAARAARSDLPSAALARVLARVRPAMRPERPRRWWPVMVGAALAAASVVWLMRPSGPTDHELRATLAVRDGAATFLGVGEPEPTSLASHQGVMVQPGGRVVLDMGAARLAALGGATVRLSTYTSAGAQVFLDAGELVAELTPQGAPRTLEIDTRLASVRVIGTLLAVQVAGDAVQVSVSHGEVIVHTTSGREVHVGQDTAVTVAADGEATTHVLNQDDAEHMQAAVSAARPPAPPDSTSAAPAHVVPKLAPAATPADNARAGRCAAAESSLGKSTDIAADMALVADCYYGAGDLGGALRIYKQLSERFADTPAGKNASYECGRIALELGRKREARAAFERYVERDPSGPLIAEAAYRICALQYEDGDHAGALACTLAYRRSYPQGRRAHESLFLEATIRRTDGDCAAAVHVYDAYLATPGDLTEQARQWRAWCQAHGSSP